MCVFPMKNSMVESFFNTLSTVFENDTKELLRKDHGVLFCASTFGILKPDFIR